MLDPEVLRKQLTVEGIDDPKRIRNGHDINYNSDRMAPPEKSYLERCLPQTILSRSLHCLRHTRLLEWLFSSGISSECCMVSGLGINRSRTTRERNQDVGITL